MEILYLIIFFILGSFVGTISTILGLRIPKKEKILGNKLHCDSCSHELTPKETIPLFSYIIQQGRCRHCHSKIDVLYPYMEFQNFSFDKIVEEIMISPYNKSELAEIGLKELLNENKLSHIQIKRSEIKIR